MYQHILLPLDLNHLDESKQAIAFVTALAKSYGAKITAMTSVPDFGMSIVGSYFPKDFEKQACVEAEAQLEQAVAGAFDQDLTVARIVGHGKAYKEINRIAEEQSCDLIVVTSGHRHVDDYLLGSNAARVVRHARTSVHVIRGT